MRAKLFRATLLLVCAYPFLQPSLHAVGGPEEELIKVMRAFYARGFVTDWQGVEKLPGVRWAPLPPTELQTCLPDGGCYARQGVAVVAGRNIAVVASGARTIVTNLFLRNMTAPFGESAIVTALQGAAVTAELVRCPLEKGKGSTNWYRLTGANSNPGYLSIQTSCNGTACEGFVLTLGEKSPPLEANQLRLYTEQCSASGVDRKPISSVLPHVQLARTLVTLLPQAAGPALYDWQALVALPTGIVWPTDGAKRDISAKSDAWIHQGQADYSGRAFYFVFGGSPAQVKTVQANEGGLHARGEDLLGVLRSQRFTVQLVRCGPVYTESANSWYRVTSSATRPVMLQQSIRMDGNRVQDSYELRLDSTLPVRDPRDRDPGANGCR
ncbi:MAG: hypothetical protein ABI833_14265 [Acidobacteriota bacterium]